MAQIDNKTCARLEVYDDSVLKKKTLFVESVWGPSSFSLAASDAHHAWTFEGSEEFVKERAEMWDKSVSWVMEKLKFYLSVEQPGVMYHFSTTRDSHRKLSFEIHDKDTSVPLTANFLMINAPSENVISDMLGFLLHGNEKLTVEYMNKCRSFDQLEAENKALLDKIEQLKNEKFLFQQDIFPKFGKIINTKKRKLRELREKLQQQLDGEASVEKDDKDDTTTDED